MISAPILGLLADRFSRWIIVGSAVILWSLASGGSGLAATFAILFATRILSELAKAATAPRRRPFSLIFSRSRHGVASWRFFARRFQLAARLAT
jgi:MFS family permease